MIIRARRTTTISGREFGMRLLASTIVLMSCVLASPPTYHVLGDESGPWPKILSSIGLQPISGGAAGVVVVRRGSPQTAASWKARIEQGLILVLEGESDLAEAFGF